MVELSVIIPTYNRAEQLRSCLEALSRQTQLPASFEVIVVVDGATDGTCEMLANLATPYPLSVICQKNSGQHIARNRGVAAARGPYCLFLDDDIVPDSRLVAEHLKVQRERGGVVGAGQITITLPPDADWFVRCFAQWWRSHYARLNQAVRPLSWTNCYGGNLSVPRAAFLDVGGFAVDFPRSHDIELGYRLGKKGLAFVYLPEAIGNQDQRKGIQKLAADAKRAGVAWVKLYHRYPPVLPKLLGTFREASRFQILLRRILLPLNISPRLMALIGLLPWKRSWAYRWYDFLHGYWFWRGVRQAVPDRNTWQSLTHGTPILIYHAFGGKGERPSRYVVPVRRFARQMAWLKWMGCRVLSLEEFLRYRLEYRLPPARSVVITIDDGYADTRTLAYPVLRRYGFPATIFVVSGRVGASNQWSRNNDLSGRPILSWSQIQEMLSGRMQFGAHTRTHPVLTQVSAQQAQEEIEGSRKDLESELQLPIRFFAYPHGAYDSTTQEIVEKAGFLGSCSTHSGLNIPGTPPHALRRVEIWGTESFTRFALRLWFGDPPILRRLRKR